VENVTNYFAPGFHIVVNGAQIEADVSYEIEQVTVVSKPDWMDTFSFTIANPMPTMRWTHTDDADLFKEGNAVTIFMGYGDEGMQDMIEGEITTISPSFPAGDIPTVAVEGKALLHRLQGSNNTQSFLGMSDQDIAQRIGQKLNLQVEADPTPTQYDYVLQSCQTDLEFLRERARKIHFEILVVGKTLKFRKSQEGTPKTYTLVWAQAQQQAAEGSEVLPLTTFSMTMNASATPTKVQSRGWDPTTKQALISNADSDDQTSEMGGSNPGGSVNQSAFKTERMCVHVTTPFASQTECDAHAKASYNNQAMGLVTGTAETIGVPDLKAGTVIQMLGVGPRFEGFYRIDEATHTISGDGYKTQLKVTRNSVS
jgi:phage protein D